MNALQKTLAVITFMVLATQTVRHTYLLWFEPKESVLDKYQPLKGEIASIATLDELLRRYDETHKQVEAARQEWLKKPEKDRSFINELETEPYKTENMLHEAITGWEAKSKEIRELRFYWSVGFLFFVAGLLVYKKQNRWLGLTLLITSFSEIIYWTSPTIFGSNTHEFQRLLVNKLAFSVVSLILLIAVIWFLRVFAEQDSAEKQM